MQKIRNVPICGVCGDLMIEEKGVFKCKTCEYFFGMSTLIKECKECKSQYGYYPRVEKAIVDLSCYNLTNEGEKFAKTLCPNCRENSRRFSEIGRCYTQMMGITIKKGQETPNRVKFEFQSLTFNKYDEFVHYCLSNINL